MCVMMLQGRAQRGGVLLNNTIVGSTLAIKYARCGADPSAHEVLDGYLLRVFSLGTYGLQDIHEVMS